MSTVTDSFNRPNNPLTLGTADSGQLWVPKFGSTWGVISNAAYAPVLGTINPATQGVTPSGAIIDSGMHNIIVQATVTSYGNTDIFGRRDGFPGIFGWYIDEFNYLILHFRGDFQIWTYYEITGGFQTDVHFFNFEQDPIADGDVMKIVLCEGPPATIQLWQNSTQLLGANITHPAPFGSATMGGISGGTHVRLDDFSIIQNPACADNTAVWFIPPLVWTAEATNAGPQPPPPIETCSPAEAEQQLFPRVQRVVDFRQEIHRNMQLQISTHSPFTLYGYSMEWVPVSVSELTEQRNAYGASWQFTEYGHLFYLYIGHISTADLTLTVTVDAGTPSQTIDTYTVANTGGTFRKDWVILRARKGKLFDLKFHCANEFQIIPSQSSAFGKEYKSNGAYNAINCFGDQT